MNNLLESDLGVGISKKKKGVGISTLDGSFLQIHHRLTKRPRACFKQSGLHVPNDNWTQTYKRSTNALSFFYLNQIVDID